MSEVVSVQHPFYTINKYNTTFDGGSVKINSVPILRVFPLFHKQPKVSGKFGDNRYLLVYICIVVDQPPRQQKAVIIPLAFLAHCHDSLIDVLCRRQILKPIIHFRLFYSIF